MVVKNKIIKTTPRERILELETLPFPNRSLIDLKKYNKYIGISHFNNYISLFASRGCPFKCIYCHKLWPKKALFRPAENLFAELKLYYEAGYRNFAIVDDVFNFDHKNSIKFFNLILKNDFKVQLSFPNGLRGDILSKDYIDVMFEAGVKHLGVALETASPRLQKMIGKNLNIEKLKSNVDYITKNYPEAILDIFIMLGFPTETEKEAEASIGFIEATSWFHFPLLHSLHIYPGSKMEKLYLDTGGTQKAVYDSGTTAFHELPETLPFPKQFMFELKENFLQNYLLNKERLANVLPVQMGILSEQALLQKYSSYLEIEFNSMDQLLKYLKLDGRKFKYCQNKSTTQQQVNINYNKIKKSFPLQTKDTDACNILLLDLSKFFESTENRLNHHIEHPLGILYLMAYLDDKYGSKIKGKVAKSRIDFNSYQELRSIMTNFKPDIIGLRTLTVYKEFFHKTVDFIKSINRRIPIVTGGPYATSEYDTILEDENIDIVVLGEGEVTFGELIGKFLANNKKLPNKQQMKNISGVAFRENLFPNATNI